MERRRLVILTWLVVIFSMTTCPQAPTTWVATPSSPTSPSPTPTPTPTPSPWWSLNVTAFPTVNPACPKAIILKETSGVIRGIFYSSKQSCSWQIIASKGKRVKLVIQYLRSQWCKDCSCNYLGIESGFFADGTPSKRMCGDLLASVTVYSYVETLKVMLVTGVSNRRIAFHAAYNQINSNYSVSTECSNYRFLNESNRAVTYMNKSVSYLCDSKLSGWYRFNGDAGSQMAESCPNMYHCTTDSPGWLSGSHPTVADGVVQRKVCFHSSSLFYRDCCLYSSYISVRNCGAFYVYKLHGTRCYRRYCGNALPQAPECFNYALLNDSNRARTYKNNTVSCTDSVLSGWYRFGREAGIQMANSCVQMNHCGTVNPGWLSGGHPAVADGTVVRKVCFTTQLGCCQRSIYITVRNCGGFYVYNLTSLRCPLRYCAGNGSDPTTAFTTEEPSTPTTATTMGPTTYGPIIIIEVQLKIFEGENETLKCDTVHDKHDWSRGDGERVTNERRVLIAENSKLQITGATILDSGEYVCQHSGRKRYIFTVEIEVIVKVEAVLKVFTYKYTPELQNKSSKIYKQTERNFTATMDKVYNNTPGYNRTEVLGFTNGSVNVDFRIIIFFIATDPKNVSKVTDTKAEAGHKVIVEVQDGLLNDLRVSPDVEVKVPPLEPRSITIFDVEHNELSIKWRPPEDSKNFKVSEYVVQHRKFGVKPPIYKNSTFPASEEKKEYSYRIQNLVPETTYMIQVGARNKFGTNYNDEQPKETLSAPFAKWLIAVIVLAGILVVATIVGVIICLRRKAAERRRNAPEEDEDTRFGSMRLASLSQYEDRYVKGVRYAYTNDFFKTSDVHWKEIPYENITLLNELGSGAFGVVYKGEIIREKGDVTPCAVKSLKASATKEEVRDLYNELEIMTKVGYHPNLVNLLGACTEDGHLLVVLELAENGSLLEFLKKSREVNQNYENINSGGITEELKLRIAIDVARGMSHLASFKCIHRDLAARNVLLGENYVAKVADYGMARDVYEQLMYRKETQGKLPVKWMAIESLETYVFTMESDVWSYGVLLWEIESGGLKPYAGMSTTELIAQLKKGYRLEIPVGCSDAMYQVMRDCWDPNPKARPTFDKLVVRLENMAVAL